ncbi:hypothetical protein HBO43_22270 [Pseudomonas veronii]|uniref:DUF3077 domain-containing protein n=1 Tax=Pseudomonas veronii TaxID=76761 RepID=A0A7Y1F519_PSEVE|nr:hypothetical protein [Pseudomonas veronii]NMX99321.1 hypothetical protein [Pseudomonas veronii]
MSHPKNTTTPSKAQLPKLKPCTFGEEYTDLFSINSDANLIEALSVASDLSDGISQLCSRLAYAINDGEIAYLSEVRTLGFIGDVVSALTRSAERGLKAAYEAEDAQ